MSEYSLENSGMFLFSFPRWLIMMTSNEGPDYYVTLPFRESESLSPHSSLEQTRLNGGPKRWEWHYVSYIIFTLR
jgi:hypothetical protein